VSILRRGPNAEYEQIAQNGQTWKTLHESVRSIDLAIHSGDANGVNFVAPGTKRYVKQARISAGFFRVLGVTPQIGREFSETEDHPGGPSVVVVSDSLWRTALGGDPSAVGRTATLRGELFEVVGVMPPGLLTSAPADVWTPLRATTTGEGGGENFEILGRLKPGVSWIQGNSEIQAVGREIVDGMHLKGGQSGFFHLLPLQTGLAEGLREPLLMLWSAVGLVLLIGCVNIAGLLLARGAARKREFATRLALGSGRAAIVRQLLAESLVLAMAGGLAGTLLGWGALKGLKLAAENVMSVWQPVSLDGRVLAITAGLSLVTSLVFGLYPAFQATRVDIRSGLAAGGRGATGGRKSPTRGLLVVLEVALGVVLLVGAGLLVRTLASLMNLNPGFDGNHVITASLSMQDARYATAPAANRLYDESLARIRALPGVESAGVGLRLPYERALNNGFKVLDGPHAGGKREMTNLTYITPGYFETLRVPLRRGRFFRESDRASTQPVAIVNEAFVQRYLSGQEVVGSHVAYDKAACEIVGVVGDVQQRGVGWGNYGPIAPVAHMYIPAAQTTDSALSLIPTWFAPSWVVRSSVPLDQMAVALQSAVASVDPQLPFASFQTMDQVRSRSLAFQRLEAGLLGSIAGLALLLAAIGIYGTIASSVTERTREFGIRIALGSSIVQAVRAVALPGILLATIGLVLGCVLARAAATLLRSLIWGVTPGDPVTFAGVCALLLLAGFLASVLPSLRVARINPAETLREE
jgi:predicted permease